MGIVMYDLVMLFVRKKHRKQYFSVIIYTASAILLTHDLCYMIMTKFRTLEALEDVIWNLCDRIERFLVFLLVLLYAAEVQKVFTGITPDWTAKRILRYQIGFACVMLAVELPSFTFFVITMEYRIPSLLQTVRLICNTIWGILNVAAANLLSIRTLYIVMWYFRSVNFTDAARTALTKQYHRCLTRLVPIFCFTVSSVLIYVGLIATGFSDPDYTIGLLSQSLVIWSFCLYQRLLDECKEFVKMGLDMSEAVKTFENKSAITGHQHTVL
ncbi:hypothetical protein EDD86DRAFT_211405 [Gorgonomyces haynaldii]|nr:hypothetical protein EDD86DRAFT_211405 [Gorgonomyces haynaldii]